jgi:DNA-binding FadR family transcriptional regulator
MSVTDDAILEIKRLIISGRLGPGEKLPRESELAAQLGLSRSSLREAVRALALIGVLNTRQGDGTYVTGLGPPLLLLISAQTSKPRSPAALCNLG